MKRFSGKCYGGPLDGSRLSYEHPCYRIALRPRLNLIRLGDVPPPNCAKTEIRLYLWDETCRVWWYAAQ